MTFNAYLWQWNMLKALLRKEFLCEWRSFHQLAGLLSFMLAVAYLVYFFGGDVNPKFWNLMYWIIFLFLVFFSATRSFEDDNNRFKIYTNQLASIKVVFLSKALYQLIECVVFGLILMLIMALLLPQKHLEILPWVLILVLMSVGMSVLNTFTAFIASNGQTRQVLMVVISLPLCFPLIGMSFALTIDLLTGQSIFENISKFYPLLAIDFLAMALVTFLLPLTWKN